MSSVAAHRRGAYKTFIRSGIVRLAVVLAMLVVASAVVAGEVVPSRPLPVDRSVGQRLANFTLHDAVSGRDVMLYGFAGKKAAVLVFLGADCPLAKVYAPRLAELNRDYRARGVAFVGINSNAHESEDAIREQVRSTGSTSPC